MLKVSSALPADELRKLSWSGIPKSVRPTAWKILSVSSLLSSSSFHNTGGGGGGGDCLHSPLHHTSCLDGSSGVWEYVVSAEPLILLSFLCVLTLWSKLGRAM